jgi:hypothetical protein
MVGFFGVNSCDEIQRENALRPLTVYPLESINGFTKLSDLLASVTKNEGFRVPFLAVSFRLHFVSGLSAANSAEAPHNIASGK